MKNHYSKVLFISLFCLLIIPSVTYASWWNPASWFNNWSFSDQSNSNTTALEQRIAELENKLKTNTSNVSATSTVESGTTSITTVTPVSVIGKKSLVSSGTQSDTQGVKNIATQQTSSNSGITTPTSIANYSVGIQGNSNFVSINAIWQNPNLYIGQSLTTKGKVAQVVNSNGGTSLILALDPNLSSGLVSFEVDSAYIANNQIKNGTSITVTGTLQGLGDSSILAPYQLSNPGASYYINICPFSGSAYCQIRQQAAQQQATLDASNMAAQQAAQQQATLDANLNASLLKQQQMDAVNLKIANLNAKYAKDMKTCSSGGGTMAGVYSCQDATTSRYNNDYNTLMAEFQLIKYSN